MSAATEQNNGDVTVEKVAAAADVVDAASVKEDLKSAKPTIEEKSSAKADNGTTKSKDNDVVDEEDGDSNARSPGNGDESNADSNLSPAAAKGTKRPSTDAKTAESKKSKKEKAEPADGESGDEEILEEITDEDISEVESDEYDIPYDEDDIECEDDDDENDDGSGSDDQA